MIGTADVLRNARAALQTSLRSSSSHFLRATDTHWKILESVSRMSVMLMFSVLCEGFGEVEVLFHSKAVDPSYCLLAYLVIQWNLAGRRISGYVKGVTSASISVSHLLILVFVLFVDEGTACAWASTALAENLRQRWVPIAWTRPSTSLSRIGKTSVAWSRETELAIEKDALGKWDDVTVHGDDNK